MVAKPSQLMKKNHSTKLEFLVLKWAIMEHFKEHLLYQPFLVRTHNNPLTYIMTTPNLDITGHQWAGALVRFNFQLEYQKGWDNTVVDMLSQITTCLSSKAVQSILDGVTLGMAHRAEGHDPTVVEGDHNIEREVCVAAGQVQVEMYVTDWATAQREDPVLNAVLNWLEAQEKTNLRHFWESMLLAKKAKWYGRIIRILQCCRTPSTYPPCPKRRMRTYYSSLSLKHIESLF